MKKGLEEPAFGGVQVIERALSLLEHLALIGTWVGVSELSQATGQPVGTVHRLLMTLLARGYVARDERTRRYTIGPACHFLTARPRFISDWKTLTTPLLQQLAELSGETANLAVLDRDCAVYVAQAQSGRLVRMFAEIGKRIPLHATSCGKVLLAYQPEMVSAFLIEQMDLRGFTSTTITDVRCLREELKLVRLRGYAIDFEEQEEGVCCLAVPVLDAAERIQAALSISGPSNRLSRERLICNVSHLKQTSAAITGALLNA